MATTTIRVTEETHHKVRDLACDMGKSIQEVLAEAVEWYRRERLFDRADAAYAALQANPVIWTSELDERRQWDATLLDGLEDE